MPIPILSEKSGMKSGMTVGILYTAEWLPQLVVHREFLFAALFTMTTFATILAEESGCPGRGREGASVVD